ncbi:MAG: type II secretion system GspH family protein [Candidatus Peregrinibacteria bacterium]|nr:type II secretion system GspH family protein [Candidatus Peregrinibacteria bacterium]
MEKPIFSIKKINSGFTLLEMLLVVAAIAILAGIVIVALNPYKQLGDTKNAQRYADVNTILNAVYQYSIDNDGALPGGIPITSCGTFSTNEICNTDANSCDNLVNLSELTLEEKYLIEIPRDPTGSSTNGSGYHISQTSHDRITVCAPDAEQGETIEGSR